MLTAKRPKSRSEFEIAVVCALRIEYDAVALVVDEFWDDEGDTYGKAQGDPNTYTTGRIGKYNVVLALLSTTGTVSAASASASLRSSYTGLTMALLTGVCGGVPFSEDDEEIILGDVVISKTVVQYDLGKQYPGHFARKNIAEGNCSPPTKDIRNLIALVETDRYLNLLHQTASQVLDQLQTTAKESKRGRKRLTYERPPASQDILFRSDYVHKHRDKSGCGCSAGACASALTKSCEKLQCDEACLIDRKRLEENDLDFDIFVGCFGSGNTTMKSGEDRDRLSRECGMIAFEMEGAGVWDEIPSIVIKGVCDYADSHKNKKWQPYAAATAASVMKALLARSTRTDKPEGGHLEEQNEGNSSKIHPQPLDIAYNQETNGGDSAGSRNPTVPQLLDHRRDTYGSINARNVFAQNHISGGNTNISFK
ncbi:phosphorylase superfamily protein [Colletotrichum sp. SAR 10_99]|nr:phosphorylase superfamily protein [Colletotrichum sp. SAR 10_98]KAJ5004048.1 phosphorylase superfamily protein [Colletotrichum sp. SAR 10_99]